MEKTITFNGIRFNWDGKYYAPVGGYGKKAKRLHQEIWMSVYGEIPEGYHVHHKNKDRTDNTISNLELVLSFEHNSEHAKENWKDKKFRKKGEAHLHNIRHLTKEWHASEEGRIWHSEQSKAGWKNRKKHKKTCEECNVYYETFYPDRSKFCNQNCKARANRRRRRL